MICVFPLRFRCPFPPHGSLYGPMSRSVGFPRVLHRHIPDTVGLLYGRLSPGSRGYRPLPRRHTRHRCTGRKDIPGRGSHSKTPVFHAPGTPPLHTRQEHLPHKREQRLYLGCAKPFDLHALLLIARFVIPEALPAPSSRSSELHRRTSHRTKPRASFAFLRSAWQWLQ